MRPNDEIRCEIPRCNGTITPDSHPFVAETGICGRHTACIKCHALGTMSINKRSMDKTPYAKCTVCAHYFPLHQYVDVIVPYWSSLMGVLHRHNFDWQHGSIVDDVGNGAPPSFLDFEAVGSEVWGSMVPSRADASIDQVVENVALNWIAQDLNYIYTPYVHEGNVKVKKYLRDIRRYIPTFLVTTVFEVTMDLNSAGYKEQRAGFDSLGLDGRKR